MKYYLSWSTAGLINEYCQFGEALIQGRRLLTNPLDGVERLTIDGVEYEAFNTSAVSQPCVKVSKVKSMNSATRRFVIPGTAT